MRSLRFATYLAPRLAATYAAIARHVGEAVGASTSLSVGSDYDRVPDADVTFLCGLAYVELVRHRKVVLHPLAAPVLQGARFAGRPIYFSDVVVCSDSDIISFDDLRGRSWAFNERLSQSGFGVTRHHLATRGDRAAFFSHVVEAGFHDRALRMVVDGEVDAAAIDCHVLALAIGDDPSLERRLRVVASLGPSTIQPVVVHERVPPPMRAALRRAFVGMAESTHGRAVLAAGLIDRFVSVDDAAYDDIRSMRSEVERDTFAALV